jgi:hypothetical protein
MWQLRIAAVIVVMALGTAVVLRQPGGAVGLAHRARASDQLAAPMAKVMPGGAAGGVVAPMPPNSNIDAERRAEPRAAITPPAAAAAQPHAGRPPAPAPLAGAPVAPQRATSLRADALMRPSTPMIDSVSALGAGTRAVPGPEAPRIAAGATDSNRQHIVGRVVDATAQDPIPAAAVVVMGTTIGQNTNDSGAFTLDVPKNAQSITVRRIGYLAQNVPLTPGTTDYTITLKKDVLSLETEVVTGVTTNANSQSVASAAPVGAAARALNGATGGRMVPLTDVASTCPNRVLRVATTSLSVLPDSVTVWLTHLASTDPTRSGFVFQVVPDTAATVSGTWQPLGRDSAIVEVHSPAGIVANRVRCR